MRPTGFIGIQCKPQARLAKRWLWLGSGRALPHKPHIPGARFNQSQRFALAIGLAPENECAILVGKGVAVEWFERLAHALMLEQQLPAITQHQGIGLGIGAVIAASVSHTPAASGTFVHHKLLFLERCTEQNRAIDKLDSQFIPASGSIQITIQFEVIAAIRLGW